MFSISMRGTTKTKFQDKCKQLGVPMRQKLEELINAALDKTPTVREQGVKVLTSQGNSKKESEKKWDTMSISQQNTTLAQYHRRSRVPI